MRKKPRLLFVIADGGKARFVERDADSGAFRAVQELDGADRLDEVRELARQNPSVRGVQSATGVRHATGEEDPYRQVKADFAEDVASAAIKAARTRGDDGLVLVAPSRILHAMTRGVGQEFPVLQTLSRDLSNTPVPELERWLAPLERGAIARVRHD